jgi:hypothetical protein
MSGKKFCVITSEQRLTSATMFNHLLVFNGSDSALTMSGRGNKINTDILSIDDCMSHCGAKLG